MKRKWKFILMAILVVLIAIRVVAPTIILQKLNQKMANFSPAYSIHIEDLDLAVWRGSYRLKNIVGRLKANDRIFSKIESIDVSLAVQALIKGKILTDILVNGGEFVLTKDLLEGSKNAEPKNDAKKAANEAFPLRVNRVQLRSCVFEIADLIGAPQDDYWRITSIDGWITNLTPTETLPLSQFGMRGTLLESSTIKAAGEFKKMAQPIDWNVDVEMREFELVRSNPWLKKIVPFSFTAGHLDMYVEAKSENGAMSGYVKPFLKKVKILNQNEGYVSFKHFAFEVVGALGNLILRKSNDKTVAAKIPFYSEAGALKVRTTEILPSAIAHGFGDPLPQKIDDTKEIDKEYKD